MIKLEHVVLKLRLWTLIHASVPQPQDAERTSFWPRKAGSQTLNVESHQVIPPDKASWETAVPHTMDDVLTSEDVFSFSISTGVLCLLCVRCLSWEKSSVNSPWLELDSPCWGWEIFPTPVSQFSHFCQEDQDSCSEFSSIHPNLHSSFPARKCALWVFSTSYLYHLSYLCEGSTESVVFKS